MQHALVDGEKLESVRAECGEVASYDFKINM